MELKEFIRSAAVVVAGSAGSVHAQESPQGSPKTSPELAACMAERSNELTTIQALASRAIQQSRAYLMIETRGTLKQKETYDAIAEAKHDPTSEEVISCAVRTPEYADTSYLPHCIMSHASVTPKQSESRSSPQTAEQCETTLAHEQQQTAILRQLPDILDRSIQELKNLRGVN